MTIKELIKELESCCEQDATVCICHNEWIINKIKIDKAKNIVTLN